MTTVLQDDGRMAEIATVKPDIIVIDQNHPSNSENNFLLSKPTKVLIRTGNIANWNSLKSRKTQLPANELYHSLKATIENWNKDVSENELENKCYDEELFKSEEERPLVKITAKILLHKFDEVLLDEALNETLKTLNIKYFDQITLSVPPVDDLDKPFEEIIAPFWKKMERFHSTGLATHISSSDLDREKLQALIKVAKIKPEFNQVNLTSCCHMPEDLVAFAKEVNVVLHTHGDQPVLLPEQKLEELITSVAPDNNLNWETNWIVRYAVVVKCRGVIKSKGYIASIQSYSK
ncbi:glutamate--cysteine ligase regulatory subunit-like isoform X2 [Hydractinia symbiolongicarpus]|nr:glutamate--cysteine ligase regulatory subunit-like isoform X2 [Hydractinia symbiolongicarpus]